MHFGDFAQVELCRLVRRARAARGAGAGRLTGLCLALRLSVTFLSFSHAWVAFALVLLFMRIRTIAGVVFSTLTVFYRYKTWTWPFSAIVFSLDLRLVGLEVLGVENRT